MESPNILLTGDKGFIGSLLKQELANKVITYKSSKRVPSQEDLENQLKGIQIVIHFAGGGGNKFCRTNPKEAFSNNILLTKQLVEAAKKVGLKQFIFASTIATYGTFTNKENPLKENDEANPDEIYGAIKWCCEELVKELPFTILRFANIYGYGTGNNINKGGFINKSVKRSAEKNNIQISSTKLKMDFLHITDAINAIIASIENKKAINQVINIGSGEAIKLIEVAKTIKRMAKSPVTITYDKEVTYKSRWLDITKAKEILKWNPKISLETGIQELLNK